MLSEFKDIFVKEAHRMKLHMFPDVHDFMVFMMFCDSEVSSKGPSYLLIGFNSSHQFFFFKW